MDFSLSSEETRFRDTLERGLKLLDVSGTPARTLVTLWDLQTGREISRVDIGVREARSLELSADYLPVLDPARNARGRVPLSSRPLLCRRGRS